MARPRRRQPPRNFSALLLLAAALSHLSASSNHLAASLFVPVGTPITRCSPRHNNGCLQTRRRDHANIRHASARKPLYTSANFATRLYASKSSNEDYGDELPQILRRYGFGSRLVTLDTADLSERPVPAEIYEGGSWKLCLVVGFIPPSSNGGSKPPLANVVVMKGDGLLQEEKVVDIGQITTLWQDYHDAYSTPTRDATANALQSSFAKAQEALQTTILPKEKAMQNLYNGRMANRARPPSHNRYALTKKQIPKLALQSSNPAHLEELLRSLFKVGEDRASRLVDSSLATEYLYSDADYCRDGDEEVLIRRMVAAQVLTEDAVAGGRFKRRSCQFVSAQYNEFNPEQKEVAEVTLVNGGWIAVDPSTKAGTEGRKFATTKSNANDSPRDGPLILTAADERIAHRLECLAMGDVWNGESEQEEEETMLEVDVRAALTSMNLPLTAEGATKALVKIGRWSAGSNDERRSKKAGTIEPWSPELLEAARSLASYEDKRRETLAKICYSQKKKDPRKPNDGLEGRVDLTSLPCVCIDAKRATFLDDSIGIRLRSSTGRRVNKAASKWEVLVHIADVSDIYFQERQSDGTVNVDLLRRAAERRGQSRYDLPLGPLHLLPPVALTALSLATNKENTVNRCVTLWAYIDERDGKLLEAGLERTIISSPRALAFNEATQLLESDADDVPKSLASTKAVISVAERNLDLWSKRHRQLNQAAQKREKRLSTRERISKELSAASGAQARDDGVGGSFQRSRGHRMVDSALDLYAFALGTLVSRSKQPIPRAAGSGADRGGRLGTAPLRRYIDGIAQRQALSVLCGYGKPLTLEQCRQASKIASLASDNIANLSSAKQSAQNRGGRRQVSALHDLARHLQSAGGANAQQHVRAMSTGHNNQVVILGTGATASCKGVKGTLKSGQKLLVQVDKINPEAGLLKVSLVQ